MLLPKRMQRASKKNNTDKATKRPNKCGTRKYIDGRTLQEMNSTGKPLREIQKGNTHRISKFRITISQKAQGNSEAGGDEIKIRAGHGEQGLLEREKDPDLKDKDR